MSIDVDKYRSADVTRLTTNYQVQCHFLLEDNHLTNIVNTCIICFSRTIPMHTTYTLALFSGAYLQERGAGALLTL